MRGELENAMREVIEQAKYGSTYAQVLEAGVKNCTDEQEVKDFFFKYFPYHTKALGEKVDKVVSLINSEGGRRTC